MLPSKSGLAQMLSPRDIAEYNESTRTKLVSFGGVPGYSDLERILTLAYAQAAHGKGAERHSGGGERSWQDQPIHSIPEGMPTLMGIGGLSYQVAKKNGESDRMIAERLELSAAMKETLGVIVYAAAKYKQIEDMRRDLFLALGNMPEDDLPAHSKAHPRMAED